jgi:hypothetical protein
MKCYGRSPECVPSMMESELATRVHEDFSHGFLAPYR